MGNKINYPGKKESVEYSLACLSNGVDPLFVLRHLWTAAELYTIQHIKRNIPDMITKPETGRKS